MYEMEGASPWLAPPGRPVRGLPGVTRRPPVPGTRVKSRFPSSWRVPEFIRAVPVSNGKGIFTASPSVAQESLPVFRQFILNIFPST